MSTSSAFRQALSCAAAMVAGATAAQAQITITSADMFNQVGQYYLAYSNDASSSNTVDVSSMLGTASSVAQAWNFATGPQDLTYRFDYIAASAGMSDAPFVAAGAQIAQQQTDQANTNDQEWLYFKVDPVKGQLDYGFYDPSFSAAQPESVFASALQDFPASIHYGSTWSGTTVFDSIYSLAGFGDYPDQVTYTSTDVVDAFGVVTLPKIGFLDCLRVHEVVEYDIAVNIDGTGYEDAGSAYLLNYYWLAPGHGIAVQINSQQYTAAPPDDLGGQAATLVRMFESNHATSTTNPPPGISGLTITLGGAAALLQWTAQTGVSSYSVEYTTNLAGTITWQSLGPTASNFMLDSTAATPGAPVRYYRVVGTVGPK
jgi:hypothetical protein